MENKVPFKRKRKDSFLRKAKKYQKRGGTGHGTHVEQDMFQYFCRVLDVWNKGFETEDDKRLFANNVLEQTQGSEMDLATSQLTSRAIETVFSSASSEKVIVLESALRKDLRVAFVDKFCSHLTQKLILASAQRIFDSEEDESNVEESFAVVCIKFAINNVEEFAWHVCACHVLRSCLEALPIMGDKMPEAYPKLFYGALIEAPNLTDLCCVELGSGLMQSLLRCLYKTRIKLCQKAITSLLKLVFTSSLFSDTNETDKKDIEKPLARVIHPVFTTQPSIRLLECAIECSNSKRFTQIYAALFINKMTVLAMDKSANLSVQALLKACEEKTEFESMFDELAENLVDILNCGNTGVVSALASSCQKHSARQGQFLHALMRCIDCSENESNLVERCLSLEKYIDKKDILPKTDSLNISLPGSLIIQSLLHFHKPIKVINSLLHMDTKKLVQVLSDPRGSHIADAFFTARYVGEKSRDKLFHKIKEELVDLVVSKHGSRSFDAMWNGINMKNRQIAASKLSERESIVTGSQFGRIVAHKIHLGTYRHDPKAWSSIFSSNNPKQLFSDIIGKG